LVFLIIATTLEAGGDAVLRMALYDHTGPLRAALFAAAAALLFGYGLFLNLAPFDFARVLGLYIATLFVMWQVINLLVFGTRPTLPTVVGGALVIAGGAIITFWKPA
jgi:small multidrug resistance family-3 protein